ncbi:hypothetical protein A9Q86_00590 [Flavobacteriales bacterium 33_180_T64]|nr:hypothetical protein A9Q86_00590 [Flavobacteriales bacterium 33_180_T64]
MNDGIIITLAYPETIVSHADEWYSKFLRFLFVGNKRHVRAGHAALILIDKSTGVLEYYDFGRYIVPSPNGRVRGRETDFELDFPIVAQFVGNKIKNLDVILKFFASHPKLTHGEGNLYASVCNAIDYQKAKQFIINMQNQGFIRYAAFIKQACNCARFVTDTLIASVTDISIKMNLIKSKRFTPSTIGNVVVSDTENYVYIVSEAGNISKFDSTIRKENRRLFLDILKGYESNLIGTLEPKHNEVKCTHAQWLSGIGLGSWFELYGIECQSEYRFRRISPYGNIDCDGVYRISSEGFEIHSKYEFIHDSNCQFFHLKQKEKTFRFEFIENYNGF